MEWVKPFRVYRITGRQVPSPQHDADIQEEFISEFDDICAATSFIQHALTEDPSGHSRWRVRDADGLISPYDYELMPDEQFDILGSKGQRLTVWFSAWDIFNYWWEKVNIEVESGYFSGKGHDCYLTSCSIFNIANQIRHIISGKSNSFDEVLAVGALRFSITRNDAGIIEVSGVLRSRANHGRQRLEFCFHSDQNLLAKTFSQLRKVLAHSHRRGDLLILDGYYDQK